jgi:hypothetical protein
MKMKGKPVFVGSEVRVIGPNKDDRGGQFVGLTGFVKSRNLRALYVVFSDGRAANFARDYIEAV